MKIPTTYIAIALTLLIAAITAPSASAREKIKQADFLKIKAKYEAAEKSVRDNAPKPNPKDSKETAKAKATAKVNEEIYDVALRMATESKAAMDKVNNNPKSSKLDKSIAKMNHEDAVETAEACHPGRKGDHLYRNALKALRIREILYLDALSKERVYKKDPRFTDTKKPRVTTGLFGGRPTGATRTAVAIATRSTGRGAHCVKH